MALKFIFKDEGDKYAEVLERSRALSKANACSILDNVMDKIRNDMPEQNRQDGFLNYTTGKSFFFFIFYYFLVGEKC